MKIGDIAMFFPSGLLSSLLKGVRLDIDEAGKQEILKNGLYHLTLKEEVVDKILETQYLRPSTGIRKNIISYGRASVFLFNGTPSADEFIKNLTNEKNEFNPYLNPTMVMPSLKIKPTKIEELSNYKVRGLVDDVILYEGYCILPKDKAEKVMLVPDLVRDEEGKPKVNLKTGKYDIQFREALEEELNLDRKSYKASEDYLQFVEEEAEKMGYLNRE